MVYVSTPGPSPFFPGGCPMCGGNVFDNRAQKRTPKAPDLRCGKCEQVAWLDEQRGTWRWAKPLRRSHPKTGER